jgi:anhydro-N-acetylmuramic acid kinase
MKKYFYSLGLMSGTSGDGVDASIIQSDGDTAYKVILDKYFKYNKETYSKIHSLKDKINNPKDLKRLSRQIKLVEKEITLFHYNSINKIIKLFRKNIDLIGFHGQTIFHDPKKKISKQLGDGKLLSKLTKKTVIYNFRENDLKNNGQGAPLTPIFHKLLVKQYRINKPVSILNLGGIANITVVKFNNNFYSQDIGPANCIIDEWIRKKTKKRYDIDGSMAFSGKKNKIIVDKIFKKFSSGKNMKIKSLDTKNFSSSFANRLSLKDGAATITELSGKILGSNLFSLLYKKDKKLWTVLVCGGGRKNHTLIKSIKKNYQKNIKLKSIDGYGINGDFIESQAFAYLAIRSYLNLPISFPKTTGVSKAVSGGIICKS